MLNLPPEIQDKITRELNRGEVIVWAQQPNLEKFIKKITAGSFLIWLFFIPWTAFSLFWMAGAAGFKMPDFSHPSFQLFFPLFGLPFLFIGIAGLAAPIWLPFFIKNKALTTAYVITNLRAFTIEGTKTVKYKSYYPDQLKNMEREEYPDGSGDIVFIKNNNTDANTGTNNWNKNLKGEGFYAIENVKKVASLLEKLANNTDS